MEIQKLGKNRNTNSGDKKMGIKIKKFLGEIQEIRRKNWLTNSKKKIAIKSSVGIYTPVFNLKKKVFEISSIY